MLAPQVETLGLLYPVKHINGLDWVLMFVPPTHSSFMHSRQERSLQRKNGTLSLL
jgi:hypothetical protein